MLTSMDVILEGLNDKQKQVCQSLSNYLLVACPGSGKTRTITHRIAYTCLNHPDSRKLNIAITYTNRAANEIMERLEHFDVNMNTIWAGTIHQFCMKYIVRPYAMYSERLRYGYRVIDEYVQKEYLRKISTNLGIKTGYKDPLSFPAIQKAYPAMLLSNKEIDFDQILECAYELLANHPFIRDNIAKLLRSIHVDEYQDTNEYQYRILALIVASDKLININFVGDINQAIYSGLGGVAKSAKELEALFGVSFVEDVLYGCYRSTARLTDFYSHFAIAKCNIQSFSDNAQSNGCIVYSKQIEKIQLPELIAAIIRKLLASGISESEICVVAPQWQLVFEIVNTLKTLLPEVKFDAPELTPFKYDPINPFYLLAELFFTQSGHRLNRRVRSAEEIIQVFRDDYCVYINEDYDAYDLLRVLNLAKESTPNGLDAYVKAAEKVMGAMGIDLAKEDLLRNAYESFVEKARLRIQHYKINLSYEGLSQCFKKREGVVVNVIHGIKGEEYHSVIGYGLLNGILPHWDYIMNADKIGQRRDSTLHLIYVLCSRAKENLFLFSELGRSTRNGTSLSPTDEMQISFNTFDTLSAFLSDQQ